MQKQHRPVGPRIKTEPKVYSRELAVFSNFKGLKESLLELSNKLEKKNPERKPGKRSMPFEETLRLASEGMISSAKRLARSLCHYKRDYTTF